MFPVPLNKQIIVKPDEVKNTTESGLIIATDEKTQRPSTGEVFGIGQACDLMKDTHKGLETGDHVLFMKNAGVIMDYEGQDYLIMEDKHILAVL